MVQERETITNDDKRALAELRRSKYYSALKSLIEHLDRIATASLKNKATSIEELRVMQGKCLIGAEILLVIEQFSGSFPIQD